MPAQHAIDTALDGLEDEATATTAVAHLGTAPAAPLTTIFNFPCGRDFYNFHPENDTYFEDQCAPPNFRDYWYGDVGYYSPAICPSGYVIGCTRWDTRQGPPVEQTETAVQCVPSGYSCEANPSLAYSGSSHTALMVQVRWASTDLPVLETHPLLPGAAPTDYPDLQLPIELREGHRPEFRARPTLPPLTQFHPMAVVLFPRNVEPRQEGVDTIGSIGTVGSFPPYGGSSIPPTSSSSESTTSTTSTSSHKSTSTGNNSTSTGNNSGNGGGQDQNQDEGGGGGLSAGAKAGIGVGVAVAVLAVLALGLYLLLRMRRRKQASQRPAHGHEVQGNPVSELHGGYARGGPEGIAKPPAALLAPVRELDTVPAESYPSELHGQYHAYEVEAAQRPTPELGGYPHYAFPQGGESFSAAEMPHIQYGHQQPTTVAPTFHSGSLSPSHTAVDSLSASQAGQPQTQVHQTEAQPSVISPLSQPQQTQAGPNFSVGDRLAQPEASAASAPAPLPHGMGRPTDQPAVADADPYERDIRDLMEEQAQLESRRQTLLQLQEVEQQQVALRQRIATAQAQKRQASQGHRGAGSGEGAAGGGPPAELGGG